MKNDDVCSQLFADLEDAFPAHDLACIAHAAAVADGQRPRTHDLELVRQRKQRVLMG